MAWSNKDKPKYACNGSYEIGVHVHGEAEGLGELGEDGLVKVCTAGSEGGIAVVLDSARADRNGLMARGFDAFLRSPNQEIYGAYDDVFEQAKPKKLGNFK